MICKGCGKENEPSTRVCITCGATLEMEQTEVAANEQPSKRKKKGARTAIIIVVVLVVLGICSVCLIGGAGVIIGKLAYNQDVEGMGPDEVPNEDVVNAGLVIDDRGFSLSLPEGWRETEDWGVFENFDESQTFEVSVINNTYEDYYISQKEAYELFLADGCDVTWEENLDFGEDFSGLCRFSYETENEAIVMYFFENNHNLYKLRFVSYSDCEILVEDSENFLGYFTFYPYVYYEGFNQDETDTDDTFTVYLECNNGEPRKRFDLEKPDLVPQPNEPYRKGYIFKGWFGDAACTKPWDFNKSIADRGTVIYAKWELDENTIAYNISVVQTPGGTIEASPDRASVGEAVIISVKPKAGKRLVPGSLTVNGKHIDTLSFCMPDENVVISAIFEDITD